MPVQGTGRGKEERIRHKGLGAGCYSGSLMECGRIGFPTTEKKKEHDESHMIEGSIGFHYKMFQNIISI
jgi:hypothetical protein